jgi:serine/threonine-protein kinase
VTPEGQVKILDFGLGKALDPAESATGGPGGAANSPTMTLMGTQQGVILGTAGYMSPEQAKGRVADKRSDVWAFGCVLFEMLAGRRAFEGEDITDTLAAIVRGEPDWTALPATTPPALRTLIERCVVKDRAQRLPDMSVVRYILSDPSTMSSARPVSASVIVPADRDAVQPTARRREFSLPIAAALVAAAVLATLGIQQLLPARGAAAPTDGMSRFTIVLPPGDEVVTTNMAPLALAPNGRAMAYVGLRDGRQQLFVREFDQPDVRLLPGTEGAMEPFFSPDSRWIGFFVVGQLKKISIAGTGLQDLAATGEARGGTWGADDTIYFAPRNTSGLMRVPAAGGVPAIEVTKADRGAGEISHRWPHILPDGKALLFSVWTGPGFDEHRIERLSIADSRRDVLVRGADAPFAAIGGRLIHGGRLDGILAVPWQPSQTSLQGAEPIVLPMPAKIDNEGAVAYAVSATTGTLAYLQGAPGRRLARIVWIDRAGKTEEVPVPPRDYVSATISPDGHQAVLQVRGGTEDFWIFDFGSKSFTPLPSTGGSSQSPVWSSDGKSLFYRCTRAGHRNICRRRADGTGSEERLTTNADFLQSPTSASTDGKWLIFYQAGQGAQGGNDIWKMPLEGADHTPVPAVVSPASEVNGQVSPNGQWIAYEAQVAGRFEVWVQPFAKEGPRRPVSRDGGRSPLWSRDGKELFFTTAAGDAVMVVSTDSFSPPRKLFDGRYRAAANANTNYDIARDGRFLHVQQIQPDVAVTRIEVVLNGVVSDSRR